MEVERWWNCRSETGDFGTTHCDFARDNMGLALRVHHAWLGLEISMLVCQGHIIYKYLCRQKLHCFPFRDWPWIHRDVLEKEGRIATDSLSFLVVGSSQWQIWLEVFDAMEVGNPVGFWLCRFGNVKSRVQTDSCVLHLTLGAVFGS